MKNALLWLFITFVMVGNVMACVEDTRSSTVRRHFQKTHPCPSTGMTTGSCPGYVADHIKALCAGGKDEVSNMQWQTVADASAKDKVECKKPTKK